jgi:hypothetical protein
MEVPGKDVLAIKVMYINVTRKDVLAIIVKRETWYINVPGKDVLAINVLRENCI